MLSAVGARLSYANVVATLALFVALGGSSYAALSITTKDVKNRSLKGGDLRKNTITGAEVNESKLGRVPRARTATNAATADVSKSSGTATTAGSATTAALADTAKDSQALAGQGVAAFERSSRVQFGFAPVNAPDAGAQRVLLSWPELGVELRTTDQSVCAAGEVGLGLRNTKGPGGSPVFMFEQDSSSQLAQASAGATVAPCTNDNSNEYQGVITDDSGRSLYVDCRSFQSNLRCLGIRSQP